MSCLLVSCEFAGSGQLIQTFEFDFISSSVSDLQVKINHYDSSALLCNMRLFLGHNGPELTTHAGVLGSGIVQKDAEHASIKLWKALQDQQKSKHQQHQKQFNNSQRARQHAETDLVVLSQAVKPDLVVAVAAYDKFHVFAKYFRLFWLSLSRHIACSTRSTQLEVDSHTVFKKTWATECSALVTCWFEKQSCTLTVNNNLFTFQHKELLNNTHAVCCLGSVGHPDFVACASNCLPICLKDDQHVMSEAILLTHLASSRLLQNKEFACLAYTTRLNRSGILLKLPSLYALLSQDVQACKVVACLALRTEGRSIINYLPQSLLCDAGFFKHVLETWSTSKSDLRALMARATSSARYDPDVIQLYFVKTNY